MILEINKAYKGNRNANNPMPGRPKKKLSLCTDSTKRKKIADVSKSMDIEEACEQLKKKLKSDGHSTASKILDIIVEPESAKSIYKSIRSEPSIEMTAEQAVGLIIQARLSKSAYQILRNNAKKMRHELYPPYYKVRDEIFTSGSYLPYNLQNN